MRDCCGRRWRPKAGGSPGSPKAQAQRFLLEAFQEAKVEARRKLARKALAVWPDCADAYILLADNAPAEEAVPLYEQAVAAGERAWAATPSATTRPLLAGPRTRPYMRACWGWLTPCGPRGGVTKPYTTSRTCSASTPTTTRGRTPWPAGCSPLDRDADLHVLLGQYPDGEPAFWAYTKALLAFREEGDTPQTRKLLKAARKINKHVPAYLLGDKQLPPEPPLSYSPASQRSRAVHCRFPSGLEGNGRHPRLAAQVGRPAGKRRTETAKAVGPLPLVKERLEQLPQRADVWQAGAPACLYRVKFGDTNVRPWAALVLSETDELILGHGILEQKPSAAELWDVLMDAAHRPLAGEAHRPTALRVRDDPAWRS